MGAQRSEDGHCFATHPHKEGWNMSQRTVETVLGRMLTDSNFCVRFLREPAMACPEEIADLTPAELDALLRVHLPALQRVAAQLDRRILRAARTGGDHR